MSETCRSCAGSVERKGHEQMCHSCKDTALERLRRELEEAKKETIRYREMAKALREQIEQMPDLEKELAAAKAEIELGQKHHAEARLEVLDFKKERDALRREVERLQETVNVENRKVNYYIDEKQRLEHQLARMREALEEIAKPHPNGLRQEIAQEVLTPSPQGVENVGIGKYRDIIENGSQQPKAEAEGPKHVEELKFVDGEMKFRMPNAQPTNDEEGK